LIYIHDDRKARGVKTSYKTGESLQAAYHLYSKSFATDNRADRTCATLIYAG
jgi:hypothetical protein